MKATKTNSADLARRISNCESWIVAYVIQQKKAEAKLSATNKYNAEAMKAARKEVEEATTLLNEKYEQLMALHDEFVQTI